MKIKYIIMMMLVLGLTVQGASAATYICTSANCDFDGPGLVFPGGTYSVYVTSSYATTHSPGSIFQVIGSYSVTEWYGLMYEGTTEVTDLYIGDWDLDVLWQVWYDWDNIDDFNVIVVATNDVVNYYASGGSCANETFTYYVDGSFLGEGDGSFNFTVYNDIDYSIYFSGTDEWHNFTASGDETWNPGCVLEYATISGRITANDGEGVSNLKMYVHEWYLYERDLLNTTYTDANGDYSFNVLDSDDNPAMSVGVEGSCSGGSNCATFNIANDINAISESYVFDFTWPLPIQMRILLQDSSSNPISNGWMSFNNLPNGTGTWMATSASGYTNYATRMASMVYVKYHGIGDAATATPLYTWNLQPNGNYSTMQWTLTVPSNLSEEPPVIDPILDDNKTSVKDLDADGTFLVTVTDELDNPLPDVTVKASSNNTVDYYGQFDGYTNSSGQWSFPRNYSAAPYVVSVAKKCYGPQTQTKWTSASFVMEYTCLLPPGTDPNGTGGFAENATNWNFNDTVATDDDVKTKLSSWMYIIGMIGLVVLFATYFTKK